MAISSSSMHTPGRLAQPSADTSSRLRTRAVTGAPAKADRSFSRISCTAPALANRVWFSELRYNLKDLDSMIFGEFDGIENSPIATTGLPRSVNQDSS